MTTRPHPSQAYLLRLLDYDPGAGTFVWKTRDPDMFCATTQTPEHACKRWNAINAGKPAFAELGLNGYLRGSIHGVRYRANVIAWIMATGREPEGIIDHINGNPLDNRIANLRDVTPSVNLRNAKRWSHNTSGHNGVYWNRRAGKWQAEAKLYGRKHFLGRFSKIEDAVAARLAFNAENGFSDRHGK